MQGLADMKKEPQYLSPNMTSGMIKIRASAYKLQTLNSHDQLPAEPLVDFCTFRDRALIHKSLGICCDK